MSFAASFWVLLPIRHLGKSWPKLAPSFAAKDYTLPFPLNF